MSRIHIAITLLVCFGLFSCTKSETETTPERASIYFEELPADSTGVHFSNDLIHQDDLNIIEFLYYYNGGGVALGDINNDGLDDMYFTANQGSDKLYLNLGNMKFKDISITAQIIQDSSWSTGVAMEDVNNDGFIDIYVSKVGNYKSLQSKNQLYINNGDLSFTESAASYGVDFSGFSTQTAFLDYDNDGDLDMYLLNHAVHTPRSYGDVRRRSTKDSLSGDLFYENKWSEGQNRFEERTEAAGIYSSALGYGLALSTSDINGDGFMDIYVGNDFHENDYLYLNQGNKTFKESIADKIDHTTRFTMGVDIADINNDLRADIFTLDMMPFDHEILLKSGGEDSDKVSQIKKNFGFEMQYARNTLQIQRNDASFAEVALMTDTYATDWSWSTLIQDFDNDGYNDIYVSNGIYKRPNDLNYINFLSATNFAKYDQTKQNELEKQLIDEMPTLNLPNIVFRNDGMGGFQRYTNSAGQQPSYSNGAAYSDLDNDGDLDIVVNTINQKALVLENRSEGNKASNFISIQLQGDDKRPNVHGSKIIVYADGQKFYKELITTKGFQSSSTRKLHIGLGEQTKIDSVHIAWLDGSFQRVQGLEINKNHLIQKKSVSKGGLPVLRSAPKEAERFPFVHIENTYNDYENETLIPEKLSTEGPAVAVADFNNDGYEDLFIGNSRFQSSVLYFKNADGTYTKDTKGDYIKDAIYEDVAVTVFDIENDGDLDLYVMSGGGDKVENDPQLEDRIYLNDGSGYFTRLKKPLIRTNGGSVSAGDFDGDGHDDLFIGNRSIPGGYGLSPFSYILKNNQKGEFVLLNKLRLGMVTDSQWVDLNADGLLDLIVVGDWMPITILINKGDLKFENQTKNYGLQHTNGLWNTVLVTDLNEDDRPDIIAGNTGLNFKWKASQDQPVKMYLDDFDDNTQVDPIIFHHFYDHYVPFASKDNLAGQMPSLKKKFLSYSEFAKVGSIKDLVGLDESEVLETKILEELRSMVYIQKDSLFVGEALPLEAQQSSIEDLTIYTNESAEKQLIYVGNFKGYINELGQNISNSGGRFKVNKQGELSNHQSLGIPSNIAARQVVKIGKNKFLVLANNDKSYIFEIN